MNRPCLQATKFVNHPQGDVTYGWRFYDDYGQSYNNTLESLPDDDMELLILARDSGDEQVGAILDYLSEGHGLYIGDTYYEWDQIKHLWVE